MDLNKKPRRGLPWTDTEEALLGTMTDREVAARIGRGLEAVADKRVKLGIAAFHPRERTWTARQLALLGTVADAALAARLGCTRKCVLEKRRKMGVAACHGENTPKKSR